MQTDVLDELFYANEMANNASTESKMQGAIGRISQACDNYDLKSTKKNVIVYLSAHGKPYNETTITGNAQRLQNAPIWEALVLVLFEWLKPV